MNTSLRAGRRRRKTTAALFLTPFYALFIATMVVPIGYAIWLSLFTEKTSGLGFGGTRRVFSGFGNYADALGDEKFRDGFVAIGLYCLLYIPVMVGTALALALLLDSALARARRFFQLALFLPHAVPGIIAALIWVYLYTPGLSPVVELLESGGLHWDFLASDTALFSIVNIATWEWIGYNMIIFYAALQAIPREVVEAATVDGAGPVRIAVSVKIPMIRAAVAMTMLFTIIGSLQLFTEPSILSDANPAVGSSWTPNMYAYSAAFRANDFGLAAAASVLLAVFAAALSFGVTRLSSGRRTA